MQPTRTVQRPNDVENLIGPRIAAVYELQAAWMEPKLKEIGVSWSTFQLLTTVHSAGSEATQAEIAARLGIKPPTLTESVQSHVQKGLLKQSTSPLDKRAKLLTLTPKSQKILGKIKTLVIESEKMITAALTERQKAAAAGHLDKIISHLESETL
jgi:DNA-binding MarR family transcriptional regulator